MSALFAEDDGISDEDGLFEIHFRASSGVDWFVYRHQPERDTPFGWSASHVEQPLTWPKAEAEQLMELVRNHYMVRGGRSYSDSYHDLRLVRA